MNNRYSLNHVLSLISAALCCTLLSYATYAHSLQASHARINATVPGMKVTAAYFDFFNGNHHDITLIKVTSELSDRIEIHEHTKQDGLMKMQAVNGGVNIPKGESVVFKPAGYHLMVMNLKQAVKEGDFVDLVLHFDNGQTLAISARATAPHQGH